MKKYKDYDNNPISWLVDSWKYLLNKYLWVTWLVLTLLIISGEAYGVIDLKSFEYPNGIVYALVVLLMLPISVYMSQRNFTDEQLVLFMNKEMNNQNGFLSLFAPHVFTGIIFLIVGVLSFINPDHNRTFNLIYTIILLLGLLSLFNIFYNTLNDLYYRIIREDTAKRLQNAKEEDQKLFTFDE